MFEYKSLGNLDLKVQTRKEELDLILDSNSLNGILTWGDWEGVSQVDAVVDTQTRGQDDVDTRDHI